MNVNFEYAKTLAGEGSILLLLSLIPYAGWILGIIGVILFLKGMKELSNYYQDKEIYQNALTGIRYYIVAIVAAAVAIASITIGVATATGFTFKAPFVFTAGFGVGLIAFLAGIVIAFIFYVLAALHLKQTFNTLAQKSGEASFTTGATLLWIGSLLTIILVGLLLIFVAWIFITVACFAMKPQQLHQYNPPQNTYTPPATQLSQGKLIENNQTNINNQA